MDATTRRAGLAGLQERLAECSPEEIAMLIPREVLLEAVGDYLCFGGSTYYAEGGWEDYLGRASSVEEAEALVASKRAEWGQIVHGGKIIRAGEPFLRGGWDWSDY